MLSHTENETTTTVGQCTATVICDTFGEGDTTRLITMELVYPRYIHSELMTHRMFSRNAGSSRATPLKVTCKEVLSDPVGFDKIHYNQSGMVGTEEIERPEAFIEEWNLMGAHVAVWAKQMELKYNVHKQVLNRALEPWLRIKTLVTATEWDNFFKLRLAPDAQPEMQSLAQAMSKAMCLSNVTCSRYHIPYITEDEECYSFEDRIRISAARCARVSYMSHEGKPTDVTKDLELYRRLRDSGHLTPFEHIAEYQGNEGKFYANFKNWRSLRNFWEEEDAKGANGWPW